MGFATWFMLTTGNALMTNPFIYGAKQFGGVSCWCMQINEKEKTFASFGFNDSSFWEFQEKQTYLTSKDIEGFSQSRVSFKRGQNQNQSPSSNGTENQ